MADNINAAGYELKPWWPYVRALMEGGGSVTVEQLNVTENGTYTAEAGKAYSPVVVNVESDLTTATMTVGGTTDINMTMIYCTDEGMSGIIINNQTYAVGETYEIPMYKGMCFVPINVVGMVLTNCTVTGDAEISEYGIMISGDFTIALSVS